jgi:hypothetical protein
MKFNSHKGISLIALCFMISLPVESLYALQVEGLYSSKVLVNNDSDSERNRAFQEAFKAVIIKLTGSNRWLNEPPIKRAIAGAQSYVEAIQYESHNGNQVIEDEVNRSGDINGEGFIEVTFASSLIQELLSNAKVPIWGSNRPSVLIWMVLQDSSGNRSLLTPESNPEISDFVRNFAEFRAIPIIFPVLDFEDRNNLSEEDVWVLDSQKIAKASDRYGADSILSGRLHFTSGGELIGLWKFIFQNEIDVFDGVEENLSNYLKVPLNRVANSLSSYFAVVADSTPQETVSLKVEGIRNLKAYTSLMNYVSGLGTVHSVKTSILDRGTLQLELELLGNTAQLSELIGLDRDLVPVRAFRSENVEVLHYRWTR